MNGSRIPLAHALTPLLNPVRRVVLIVRCTTDELPTGITFNAVRLSILREEERDQRRQGRAVNIDNSPGSFVCLGIELETMQ